MIIISNTGFGYVTNDGKIIQKLSCPANKDVICKDGTWTDVANAEALDAIELSVYNATKFKYACAQDPALSIVMMKAPAAMMEGINAGDGVIIKAGTDFMIAQGLATQDEYEDFRDKLIEHYGPNLDQV